MRRSTPILLLAALAVGFVVGCKEDAPGPVTDLCMDYVAAAGACDAKNDVPVDAFTGLCEATPPSCDPFHACAAAAPCVEVDGVFSLDIADCPAPMGCEGAVDDDTTTTTGENDEAGDPTDAATDTEMGDTGSFWVVGEQGAMLRVDHHGEASTYPLDATGDLRAIACRGREHAVAVGEHGLLVVTFDGGARWERAALAQPSELRAVALAGGDIGYVVGDGVVLRSLDGSRTWDALAVAPADWTAVTTTAAGTTAWLTAGDELWRLRDESLERVHVAGARLAGVAVTPGGDHLVAVGEAGLVLRSPDGGETWTPELVATTRDLHAVRIAGDASLVIAVGAAGTVVRLGSDDASVQQLLDPALSLRALHLSQTHGHAVGDDGVVFATHDHGLTWEPIAIGHEVDLLGLDDLHGEPHL